MAGPSSTVVYGPPQVLLELSILSARLLPRLKLARHLQGHVVCVAYNPTVFSPTVLLWKYFIQGIPLLLLLDLLEQNIALQGGSTVRLQIGPASYGLAHREELLAEYNRRVEIMNLQGSLAGTNGVAIIELIHGSAEELLKLVRTSLRIVQILDTQTSGFYELPPDSSLRRAKTLSNFIAREAEYIRELTSIMENTSEFLLVTPTTQVIQYRDLLKDQIDNIKRIHIYHKYVSSCLQQFQTGEHWDDLFDIANKTYAKAADAYRYYCDTYLDFSALLNELMIKEEHRTGALDILKHIKSPIIHLSTFTGFLFDLIQFSDPKESLYEYDSLCVIFSTWNSWVQGLSEAMRHRRTLHVSRQICKNAVFWDWDDPHTFGDFLMDDHVPVTMSMQSNFDAFGCPRKKLKVNCFVFMYRAMLLVCRPRVVDAEQSTTVNKTDSVVYPVQHWDLGPALRCNAIFSVQFLITTTSITHYSRQTAGSFDLSIAWATGNFGSESLVLNLTDENQFEQWSNVLEMACPNKKDFASKGNSPRNGNKSLHGGTESFSDKEQKSIKFFRTQQRSLDVASSIKPLISFLRKVKSETCLLTLKDWHLRPAEARWSQSEKPRALFRHPRRPNVVRISYEWDGLLPSKSYWIHGFQSSILSDSSEAAVPDLTGQVTATQPTPTRQGGFADVWKCVWNSRVGAIDVAVKVINRGGRRGMLDAMQEEKTRKRLFHELRMWLRLEHENVVPLLGICKSFENELFVSMVSPWYDNGNLHDFIASNWPDLKLPECMKLLSEVISGLSYLHSEKIVHGDLHSANVLINKHGVACITDFGLSRLVDEETGVSYLESVEGGATRWAAPEFTCSTSSDMYAYGCIILEVLSGKIPYYDLKHRYLVILELSHKRRPKRPPSSPGRQFLTDGMWKLANECWEDPHTNRPTAADLNSRMLLLYYRCLGSHPV
ncbi:hypothetical protein EW145_g4625 [Phellinidium pouzarii]|uniref:Protein kinase domain-containing protein n=1 Tax=Phellinidium pouzarii TaxID=167371 RepID=A0A4S4L316_9AGAM|nr:hypothetical protein EW145_g4625 [Phellinidium pouzarii]